jgi:23S rRNA pseudouridine955/2504/2580 synthase/23S rRNA pseudouridine1911/1915/1917 synthase
VEANNVAALEEAVATCKPAGILFEVVQGEGGVLPLTAEFVSAAAKLAADTWEKEYYALVNGRFTETIDAEGSLVRDTASPVRRKRQYIHGGTEGESCRTLLVPEQLFPAHSLVRAKLFTGRMHQIRATLYSLGYPMLGDKLYGVDDTLFIKRAKFGSLTADDFQKLGMKRQALHSSKLTFRHPLTGESMTFTSPLPEDMRQAIQTVNG